MIVILRQGITAQEKEEIRSFLTLNGYIVREIVGENDTVFGAVGSSGLDPRAIEQMRGVSSVIPISRPYKLASRELKKEDTIVSVRGVPIGGASITNIAGPCAVESQDQMMRIAERVRESGALILRGGAYKPRTSPYSFQGLGEEGLVYLRKAGDAFDMPVVSEIVAVSDIETAKNYVDMFQIGARNMQNFELLKAVGKCGMPVLLKRGISATIEEWLMAAEYLMSSGTDQVVLCERGIRTYERATRNTLDCSAIPMVQKLTHLPIIGDPSHATGRRDMVAPMGLALIASGASGLMVEVHDQPEKALSDGPQSLYPDQFEILMRRVEELSTVLGKACEKRPLKKEKKEEQKTEGAGNLTIAFQGVRGAFSEKAVRKAFEGEAIDLLPLEKFSDVFDSVKKGTSSFGVIPVENTLGGSISENYDLLRREERIRVVGEVEIRISHALIAPVGVKKRDIKKVYSHPQGLAQCKKFLETDYPDAELIPFFDTAGSVSYLIENGVKDAAAIASVEAASYYGAEVLRESIETNPKNYTRFFIIAREENKDSYKPSAKSDTVSFTINTKDEPGSLTRVLEVLSANGMNMTKLESRPILGHPWEYAFFIESKMDSEATLEKAIPELKECTTYMRVLGCYEGRK